MKPTIIAALMTPLLFMATTSLAGALVNVTVHQSLAEKLVNIPVNETRAVNETTADGVNVQGTATVRGAVKAKFNPEEGGAGLMLQMDTQTFTSSNQSTWPRKDIHIYFGWDITTDTTTYKRVALRDQGISTGGALAHSKSSIQYGQINSEASGLFSRIKAGVALRAAKKEIYGRHNQSVADANSGVGSQLAGTLDEQVEVMLQPAKEAFARFVQGPFVNRKLLGASVAFGGNESVAQVRVEDNPQQGAVVSPLAVSAAEPVAVDLHPKALENFLAKTLGGAVFTEIELAEMIFEQAVPVNSIEDLHQKPEELLVHFDEEKPVSLEFNADEIVVVLRGQRVESLGRSWRNVDIKRVFKVKHDGDKILLSFMDPWQIIGREGTVVDPVFAKHMVSRLDEILPQGELDITGTEVGKGLPVTGALSSLAVTVDSLVAKFSVIKN